CAARAIYSTSTEAPPAPRSGSNLAKSRHRETGPMVAARDSADELELPPVRRRWWRQPWAFRLRGPWARVANYFSELAPKGLYARTLIIIITPIVLLESVVAFTF